MTGRDIEMLLNDGEPASCNGAHLRYKLDLLRGKGLLQLQATAADMTPKIRASWAPRTFGRVVTDIGEFDALTCNVSYHFFKHGQRFRSIAAMTDAALAYYSAHRHEAELELETGLLKFPNGSTFLPNGRIVTFTGK